MASGDRALAEDLVDAAQVPQAWLGLAASYDRLKRYDLADRAYLRLREISTPYRARIDWTGETWLQ